MTRANATFSSRLAPALAQYVDLKRALGGCGDTTAHQPLSHSFQIFGEGGEYPHRMLIPVRWYGYQDFPRTDINSCCVCI
jgi:hypothetical protein